MSNQEPANKPAPDAQPAAAQPAAGQPAAAAPQPGASAAPVTTGAPAPAVSGPTPAPTSGEDVKARVESGLGTATAVPAPAVLGVQSMPVVPASGEGALGQGAGAASSSAPGAGLPLTAAHPAVTAGSVDVAATDASVADRTRPLGPLPDAPGPDKTQRLPDLPESAPAAQAAPADVGARAAAAIRDQMEILALRIQYDTQELLRVGAAAPDSVTIRLILDTWANALERGDGQTFAYTFSRTHGTLPEQINDQTLPYNLGIQIGGYFEAIVRDTLRETFAGDPALAAASSRLLDEMAAPAKRALLGEPRSLIQWQAPRV